ncbi:uncharacterized protein PITG_15197 [Phytophthora infestans T30-4]|uniref:Uncharacterized protein n=1 Tax=Phytophthora infestans (strain T30-4) TaxID=403677 RepID=D0NQ56_PHYIT|nr:uncharacterized protein PITG_15197 [Phytophthora infestans T30-4]EEY62788.1 hypothetical protein PITG_15197 [Phytophthora infestans T30-4]|eukprot:XP_002898663.1 hypothetical protein PITG_15197 [Phytophthora infestans T30-4]
MVGLQKAIATMLSQFTLTGESGQDVRPIIDITLTLQKPLMMRVQEVTLKATLTLPSVLIHPDFTKPLHGKRGHTFILKNLPSKEALAQHIPQVPRRSIAASSLLSPKSQRTATERRVLSAYVAREV